MVKVLKIVVDNGNALTFLGKENKKAPFFWSNYFTHSYQGESIDHGFFFESNVDLMGNAIKNKHSKQIEKTSD